MAELLIELLSEEIPARMQARAAEDLKRLVCERLDAEGLSHDEARAFATPRRLALVVDGLPERTPDRSEEKKGPKVGAPEKALQGFMKANGLASIEEAEVRETDKGRFYFVVRHIEGRETAEVLEGILHRVIQAMPWPKSMRWYHNTARWVRPLHSILCILGGTRVPFAIDLQGSIVEGVQEMKPMSGPSVYRSTSETRGHPFLAPEPFAVTSFADYQQKLWDHHVMLDTAERRASIGEQAEALAEEAGLRVKEDHGLLDEVAGLVEWPVALLGAIDEAFMDLPDEVMTTSMKSHQKYFALQTAEGALAPHFVVVADMTAPEGSKRRENIIAGNERVLRARLADARFFWDQDRKRSLQSRVGDLKSMVFHAKLGTVEDKVDRMTSLAVDLSQRIEGADKDRVRSAARLAKADLTTGMVGEFPELQGVMGRYYAKADGEHAEVAEAIAEHYSPLGPGERCPSAPVSVAVALADKIDTLVGFWAIDEKPTGSKDPYALRRAALGVIRLIVENGLRLRLLHVFEKALRPFEAQVEASLPAGTPAQLELAIAGRSLELMSFFAERLKVVLRDQGVRHDLISAVFEYAGKGEEASHREDDLVRLLARVEALRQFLESENGANLLVAYRRAANIVRIEEKKDNQAYDGAPDPALFAAEEEKALAGALEAAGKSADAALDNEDFEKAMDALAELRAPVDAFFDHVTVNAEDASLRANRLRLLTAIKATLERVADFSKIEG